MENYLGDSKHSNSTVHVTVLYVLYDEAMLLFLRQSHYVILAVLELVL